MRGYKTLVAGLMLATIAAPSFAAAPTRPEPTKAAEQTIVFAGGCFWCLQGPFDAEPGVLHTDVGYSGGSVKNPSYEDVSSGRTGHLEAVKIEFDPSKVSLPRLLEIFWRNIDPTQADGQFADIGPQYHTALFYSTDDQKQIMEKSKNDLQASGKFTKPIATEIRPAGDFYSAEDYHQEYYKKNPTHYNMYKLGSGRAGFIERTWGAHKE